jgi:hypothetical protein
MTGNRLGVQSTEVTLRGKCRRVDHVERSHSSKIETLARYQRNVPS